MIHPFHVFPGSTPDFCRRSVKRHWTSRRTRHVSERCRPHFPTSHPLQNRIPALTRPSTHHQRAAPGPVKLPKTYRNKALTSCYRKIMLLGVRLWHVKENGLESGHTQRASTCCFQGGLRGKWEGLNEGIKVNTLTVRW